MKAERIAQLLTMIAEVIRRFAEELRDRLIPTTGAPFSDEGLTLKRMNDDWTKDLLDSVVEDLETIEGGLRRVQKLDEAKKITLFKNIVKSIAANTNEYNSDRKSVVYALEHGMELIKQYKQYLSSSSSVLTLSAEPVQPEPEDLDKVIDDKEDDVVDPNDLPDEKQKEEDLSILGKLRKQLAELRDRLRSQGRSLRARVVEAHIKVLDFFAERLKKRQLDNTRFNAFIKRVREMLAKYAESQRSPAPIP